MPKGGAAGHGQTLGNRLFAGDFVWRDPDSFGGLDVLVSTAVAVALGRFLEVDADDFDGTVAITFTGAVNVIRAALPELRATGGVIVATSLIMASLPLPAFSSYAAAKHALRGFLNTLQIEEREQGAGVRVTMVSPGPVDTPVYKRATSAWAPARHPTRLLSPGDGRGRARRSCARTAQRAHRGRRVEARDLLYRHARPAAELVLLFVDRWFRTGTVPAEAPGALWQPSEQARASGGIPARSSET